MSRLLGVLCGGFLLLGVGFVHAQGMLVVENPEQRVRLPRPIVGPQPSPPSTYAISELDIHATLSDQVARVQVSQTFENTGSQTLEVAFVFPLPYDGAIDQLTLMVDGKEFTGRLLPADEARRKFEAIVRKNRDPALLEWMCCGMFQTSVFPIPAGESRTVSLSYTQVCPSSNGLTDVLFPLSTAKYTSQPIKKLNIEVAINSSAPLKNIYSPTHAIEIKRPSNQAAVATYHVEKVIPDNDFRLFYDVGGGAVGTSLLSYRPSEEEPGYFMLLASPEIKAPTVERAPKTVVFVLDRSGSMSGEKIEQAREALKFVLNNLREGDLFNIIAYDTDIESFRPELQRFNETNRALALGFVGGIHAGGSTNIDGALSTALGQLKDSDRPSYVLFLTDGLPTAGEVNEAKIVDHARSVNDVRARIFAFGLGFDVNSRLLDKLVRVNYGQSEYVRPDEDIEDRVSQLYRRIESSVMSNVQISFEFDGLKPEDGDPISQRYPREVYDLFEGEQMVIVGRYRKSGAVKIHISGDVAGVEQSFDFTADLVEHSDDQSLVFVEKLWASRRIGEIIDQIDLNGHNEELVEELVALSTKHGILTPYTSFLADEDFDIRDSDGSAAATRESLEILEETTGRSAFYQRELKADLQLGVRVQSPEPLVRGRAGEAEPEVANVRNLAGKSFYRRHGQWVDAAVDEAAEQNAIAIVQFSDEYFELAAQHGGQLARYLVFDEPVIVDLQGQAYRIDPPEMP